MKKEIKKCINYYLHNIGSDSFREYVKREELEGKKNHQEFIETERPRWANRTDYFDDHSIAKVIITDTLSNDGVVHLLRKLYSLPKRKFRVKNYYRFLGEKELKLFEHDFSCLANGRQKIKYSKKVTQLLNKLQSIADYDSKNAPNFYSEFENSWDFYIGNDKEDLKEWNIRGLTEIQAIYEKNFSYLKLLTEMNYTKSNHTISIIAVILSVITTAVSLIGLFA